MLASYFLKRDFRKIISGFIHLGFPVFVKMHSCPTVLMCTGNHRGKVGREDGKERESKPNSSVNKPAHSITTIIPQYSTLL